MLKQELIESIQKSSGSEVKVEVSGQTLFINSVEEKDGTVLIKTKHTNYVVTESDLIGDLEGLCTSIVQGMIEEQVKQGNPPSVEVFQKCNIVSLHKGGFNWKKSEQGYKFWHDMLLK